MACRCWCHEGKSVKLIIELEVDPREGDHKYGVWWTNLPGCMAQGPTAEIALQRLLGVTPMFLTDHPDYGNRDIAALALSETEP